MLLGLFAGACVTSRPRSAFKPWAPRPAQCNFDVFESDVEPARPYDVLGTLSFDTNNWLGADGRKAALRDTVCQSGAELVLLSRPDERVLGNSVIRSHEVRFAVYTDVPPPEPVRAARAAASAPPPPPADTLVLPTSPYADDVEGVSTERAPETK